MNTPYQYASQNDIAGLAKYHLSGLGLKKFNQHPIYQHEAAGFERIHGATMANAGISGAFGILGGLITYSAQKSISKIQAQEARLAAGQRSRRAARAAKAKAAEAQVGLAISGATASGSSAYVMADMNRDLRQQVEEAGVVDLSQANQTKLQGKLALSNAVFGAAQSYANTAYSANFKRNESYHGLFGNALGRGAEFADESYTSQLTFGD